MAQENIIQKTKNKISKIFAGREGFTDEFIEAITMTYLYLLKNFPQKINESEIPDVKSFKYNGIEKGKRTLANIYINRINNNVERILHSSLDEGVSEFKASEKAVYVPEENDKSWKDRASCWSACNFDEKQQELLRKKIRTKVIVHELIHGASYNGNNVGFAFAGLTVFDSAKLKELSDKYKTSWENLIYGDLLEEMITEVISLEIANNNLKLSREKIDAKYSLTSRNLESSNSVLNSLGEYLFRAYRDKIVVSKFVDGLNFMAWFNENNGMGYDKEEKFSKIVFSNYPEFIKHNFFCDDISKNNVAFRAYRNVQMGCLNYYLNNLKIENRESFNQTLDDFIYFSDFSVRFDGKIEESIKEKLVVLKERLNEYSVKNGINFDDIIKEKRQERKKESNLTVPYAKIIELNSNEGLSIN